MCVFRHNTKLQITVTGLQTNYCISNHQFQNSKHIPFAKYRTAPSPASHAFCWLKLPFIIVCSNHTLCCFCLFFTCRWAWSSVVEHLLCTQKVPGSTPEYPGKTRKKKPCLKCWRDTCLLVHSIEWDKSMWWFCIRQLCMCVHKKYFMEYFINTQGIDFRFGI